MKKRSPSSMTSSKNLSETKSTTKWTKITVFPIPSKLSTIPNCPRGSSIIKFLTGTMILLPLPNSKLNYNALLYLKWNIDANLKTLKNLVVNCSNMNSLTLIKTLIIKNSGLRFWNRWLKSISKGNCLPNKQKAPKKLT